MNVLLVAVFLQAIATSLAIDRQQLSELEKNMELYISKNTLGYKAKCNYQLEQDNKVHRDKMLKSIGDFGRSSGSNEDVETFFGNFSEGVSAIAHSQATFCNEFKNLHCSDKGYCGCITGDPFLGLKANYQQDGDGCLAMPGSACIPSDIENVVLAQSGLKVKFPKQETSCAKSRCISKSNRATCTEDSFKNELSTLIKSDRLDAKSVEATIAKVREGICVCAVGSFTASAILVVTFVMVYCAKMITA